MSQDFNGLFGSRFYANPIKNCLSKGRTFREGSELRQAIASLYSINLAIVIYRTLYHLLT
jgi:hypothetical protein